MTRRLVVCVLPLLLAACATTAPRKAVAPKSALCYSPSCCTDASSRAFEPHRLNCASIEQREQGNSAQAWTLLHEAIAAARAAESARPGPASEVLCFTLNDAGHGHSQRGEIDAARVSFDGNVAACRARFGEDASETGQAAYSRANFRLALGETEADVASDLATAVRIFEARNEPGLHAIALDASGRLADMQGRHVDGERLLRQALEIKRAHFGNESVEVGTTLTNLGANAIDRGDLAQGVTWYQAAMANYRIAPGPDSDRYLTVAAALASTWLAMEEYGQLESLYQDLIKATARVYGPDDERHLIMLNDYGAMLFRRGHADRAQPLFETVLRVRQRTRPHAIQTAWTAFNTAQAALKADGCRAARPHGKAAREILGRVDAATTPEERKEIEDSLRAFEQACPLH